MNLNYAIFRSQPIMTIQDLAQIGLHNKREKYLIPIKKCRPCSRNKYNKHKYSINKRRYHYDISNLYLKLITLDLYLFFLFFV